MWTFASHIVPAQKGIRALRTTLTNQLQRWIQVERADALGSGRVALTLLVGAATVTIFGSG